MTGGVGFVIAIIVGIYLLSSIKILREYERGVIFRLGRMLPVAKGPGIILVKSCGNCGNCGTRRLADS